MSQWGSGCEAALPSVGGRSQWRGGQRGDVFSAWWGDGEANLGHPLRFLFAVRDTKSPAIESGADVLAVQYWTDWIISAVAVLQNACGRVLSIPKMPQWTLSCPGCTKVFSHSQI